MDSVRSQVGSLGRSNKERSCVEDSDGDLHAFAGLGVI